MQSQKAKITEPDRIIFLENQDELAPPLFLTYAIGRAFLFYSPKQNIIIEKTTPTIKIGWMTY
jgi:hypothetical protein